MQAPEQRVFAHRTNMVQRQQETWRPPLFRPPNNFLDATIAALRRCFDLQAGSIWRDLRRVLRGATGTIVDVGCGAQPYRVLVARNATYIGIDTIEAKDHFGYEIPGTRYFSGDVWPIDDGSANVILCTETLEHVPEPARMLREAFRCLAPGGMLLLTVPFAARWHFIPYDYWRYTPSCLNLLLTAAGFMNIRVYARGNAGTVACYKVMALILRLSLPSARFLAVRLILYVLSLPFLPVLFLLTIIANISLLGRGGDDCLGYTVLAEKRPA